MYYITVEPVFYYRSKPQEGLPYIKSLRADKLDGALNKADSLLIYSRKHSTSSERYTVKQGDLAQRRMSFHKAAKLFSAWCSNATLLIFKNSDTLLLFRESFANASIFFNASNMADLSKCPGSAVSDDTPLMTELLRLGIDHLTDFSYNSISTTYRNYPTCPLNTGSISEKIFLEYGLTPRFSGKTALIETPLSCWSFCNSGSKTILRRRSVSGIPIGSVRRFNSLYSALRYVKRHDISFNLAAKSKKPVI